MAPTNTAAYLDAKKSPKLVVRSAPYTPAKENQIVIKNHALAINPVDWLIQERGDLMYNWLAYPFVLGTDVSGEVVEIGTGVSRFQVGDRVLGFSAGSAEKINDPAQGGFQEYIVLLSHMAVKIPDSMTYESACVIPLGFSTSCCGLFQDDQLSLQLPTSPPQKSTSKTLLIWGGSTSVGLNAIQLAVAAGYEVFTTCSPHNFPLVKSLGAAQAWDYNSPTVVEDIISAFNSGKKETAGALGMDYGGASKCVSILSRIQGHKVLSMAAYPTAATLPKYFALVYQILTFLSGSLKLWVGGKMKGVKTGFIFGDTLVHNGVGKKVYEGFLEEALRVGEFKASPQPEVVGKGLGSVQEAMKRQKKGVSAKKIVVVL